MNTRLMDKTPKDCEAVLRIFCKTRILQYRLTYIFEILVARGSEQATVEQRQALDRLAEKCHNTNLRDG